MQLRLFVDKNLEFLINQSESIELKEKFNDLITLNDVIELVTENKEIYLTVTSEDRSLLFDRLGTCYLYAKFTLNFKDDSRYKKDIVVL